ncbi:MAG TPA: class I SAM-dependent methyltransferase [Blastocatellia bacterium]|nr:class I SAM-dependent methyltransferase [Blastocatellia bacterium]
MTQLITHQCLQDRRSTTSFISNKFGQFRYFDTQLGHPDWSGKMVLDFGGNAGNILADPESRIDPGRYWSIDVSSDAIRKGGERFPESRFIFYNRHNLEFNPGGEPQLAIPDHGIRFDWILSYSVFTHTSKSEMLELISQLRGLLAPKGVLAFTFIDPRWSVPDDPLYPFCNLKWRLEKRRQVNPSVDVDALHRKGSKARWCTLVNDDDLYIDDEPERQYSAGEKHAYITLCTPQYMKSLFPEATVVPPPGHERQHCCILKAG